MKTLAKWTTAEYHQMIATGILAERKVELLAEEIAEKAPEGPYHTFYGEELADYLRSRLTGKASIGEGRPITLTDSEPEPDIAVVRSPRERYRDRHPGAEDIFWKNIRHRRHSRVLGAGSEKAAIDCFSQPRRYRLFIAAVSHSRKHCTPGFSSSGSKG